MQKGKDIPLDAALESRFWARVQRDEETGCLLWMGCVGEDGYGHFKYQGKLYPAHRISWCFAHQVPNLPDGHELDHLCRVHPCVDWTHVESVTASVNNLRGRSPELVKERKRRTHCARGHAVIGANMITQKQKGGLRSRCRICSNAQQNIRLKRWRQRKKLVA